MTEYEILDVIGVTGGNLINGSSVYFTVLTAYLIIAYTVGIDLTRYQVSFANIVFIIYNVISALNFATMISRNLEMSARLSEMNEGVRMISGEGSAAIISIFILMRLLLVLGALVFMWQVRHPKTE